MLDRTGFLQLFTPVLNIVEAWQKEPGPIVTWRGGARKAITGEVFAAWDNLFDQVATDDVSDDIKATVLAIDEFEDEFVKWGETCELNPDEGDPRGSNPLWSAWSRVIESLTIHARRKPEPVQTLIAQKLSEIQIGRAYQWYDENGEVQLDKVREEKAAPGTHYNPATWISISERAYMQDVQDHWNNRTRRIVTRQAASQPRQPAPETLEELIEQRVPSSQIASMKQIDIEAVKQRAAELGIPLDGQFVRAVSPVDRLADIRTSEAETEAAAADAMDTEEMTVSVLELHLDGMKPSEIAKHLLGRWPSLTHQKVAAIVRQADVAFTQAEG